MKMLRTLTAMSYPFLIFAGLDLVGPRALALVVAVILITGGVCIPTRVSVAHVSWLMLAAAVLLGVAIVAGLLNDGRLFLFVPVLINGALLIAFGRTLVKGPSIVEVFARLRGRNVPQATHGVRRPRGPRCNESRSASGVATPHPQGVLPGRDPAPALPHADLRRHRLPLRPHRRAHVVGLGGLVPPLCAATRRAHEG